MSRIVKRQERAWIRTERLEEGRQNEAENEEKGFRKGDFREKK
jgi:hypothetical protein